MDFFSELGNRAKQIATVVKDKTGDLVETSKLKLDCVGINKDIQKKYENLGALVYQLKKNGETNDELVAKFVAEIDELFVKLQDTSAKLNERKSITICPSCKYANDENFDYCVKCGTELKKETKESE